MGPARARRAEEPGQGPAGGGPPRLSVLGVVEARLDGRLLDLGPPKPRLLLAALLATEGQPVTTERLIEYVWPDSEPPAKARASVHDYASDLRVALGGGKVELGRRLLPRNNGAYVIARDVENIDLHRFNHYRRLAKAASGAGESAESVRLGRIALASWGWQSIGWATEPLAGISGRWVENFRLSLCDELRETLLACLQGELLLSRHNQVIAEITDLRRTHPLDERVAALAMMANYRAGRQDEALHVYTEIHAALADEIAGEPGPELRELQQRILRGDDTLRAAGPAARLSPASNPDERRRPTMSDDPNPNRGTAEATGREAGPDAGLDPAALAMRVAVSLAHASQDQPEPGAPVARLVQLVHTRTAGDVRATGALARLARRPDKRNALFLVRDLLVPLLAADAAFAAQADELAPHTMPAVRDRAAISMRARKIDIGKQVVFEEEVKVKGNFSF